MVHCQIYQEKLEGFKPQNSLTTKGLDFALQYKLFSSNVSVNNDQKFVEEAS